MPDESQPDPSDGRDPCWRIDELAQEAGLTVDTIRYYAREGLLAAPERAGRHKVYGREHRDRLSRIKELQQQRFSLAAIRAILNADRPGLEELFAGTGHTYSLEEITARAAVDRSLVRRLVDVGLLVRPEELGREGYDDNDLALLRAVSELREIGMTEEILVALGGIYVRHFRALQADVHTMLGGNGLAMAPDELAAVQQRLTASSARMIPAVDRVLNYVHQRMVQRLTLDAVETAHRTGTGVGGVRVRTDAD